MLMASGIWLVDFISRMTSGDNQTGATPLKAHTFAVPDAAGDVDYDIVLDNKFEVVDVTVRKNGAGAGNTVQIKSTATAITDAIIAAVDKAVTRAGQVDGTANVNVVPAGGILRCSVHRAAGSSAALVTVWGFDRP